MSFSNWYHRWTMALSLVVMSAGGVIPLAGVVSSGTVGLMMALAGVFFLSALIFRAIHTRPEEVGPVSPHLLTAVRGVASVFLLAFIWYHRQVRGQAGGWSVTTLWAVAALLALVETTDFLDGRLARKLGPSRFGAVWDMETDAFFTYSLSYSLWAVRSAVPAVLVIGWMRYLYFLLFRVEGDPPEHPRSYKLFARTVAALLVVVLILGHVPVVPLRTVNILVRAVLALQTVSFGWDFLLQVRSRGTRRGTRKSRV
jgi:phosphatidylglycerophosphate synthase